MKVKRTINSYRYKRNGKQIVVKKHKRTYTNRASVFYRNIDPATFGGKEDIRIGMSRANRDRVAKEKYDRELLLAKRQIESPIKQNIDAARYADETLRKYEKKYKDFSYEKESKDKKAKETAAKEEELAFETPIAESFMKDMEKSATQVGEDTVKGVRVTAETMRAKKKGMGLDVHEPYNPRMHGELKQKKTWADVKEELGIKTLGSRGRVRKK